MVKQFELHYELLVLYDSGRELTLNSFSMSDAESKALVWAAHEGVRRVTVRRIERFFVKKFFPTERS